MTEPAPAVRKSTWGNWLFRWARNLLVLYVVIVIVMLFLERSLVYQSQTAAEQWEEPPDPAIEEVTFPSGDDQIHAWYLPRAGSNEVLLICHGSGGNLSYRGKSLLRFREALGCSVMIFDYPGYGKSTGKPSEEGCYASAEAALKFLAEVKKVPVERVIIYGESLGGGIATEIAQRHLMRALVLLKTFTALPDVGQRQYRWLPVKWIMRNRFDSITKIGSVKSPVFVSGAIQDELVPFEMSKQLYDAAPSPKEFFAISEGGHNERVDDEFMARLKAFLDANVLKDK